MLMHQAEQRAGCRVSLAARRENVLLYYRVEKIKEKEKDARTGTQKYTKFLCTAGALVSRLPDKISSIPTIGLCDLHIVYSNSVH